MIRFPRSFVHLLTGAAILLVSPVCILAQATPASGPTPVAPVPNPCQRAAAGSLVQQPPAIFSSRGVLTVRFSYQSRTDFAGRTLFCFMTPDGLENPTLHVNPGDTINITVTNNTPKSPVEEQFNAPNCGDKAMTGSSLNIHYHGTNTTPQCGGDNVVKALINSGHTFVYNFQIPTDEPPGLYWYHPHVHGIAEAALLGGGSGLLVVDGIQNVQPAVAGLNQRLIIIRDQAQLNGLGEGPGNCGVDVPFQDITVNNVPIDSHQDSSGNVTFVPAAFQMANGETQFWRVSNSTSDSILDLQVVYDGVPQTFQIVAEDGVAVNSQDGTQPGHTMPAKEYRLAVAGRVEFLIQAPATTVKKAQFITNNINTGPQGDCDPTRAIFNISLATHNTSSVASSDGTVGNFTGLVTTQQRFGGLSSVPVSTTRTFQFSEVQPTEFFITQVSAGQQPTLFDNNNPPSVITTQGSVEKWIVQNIAQENHEFHQHQIHFKVLSQDNYELNGNPHNAAMNGQFADMIEVPFWDNVANPNGPFPQAQLLMDFRGMDIGDFVYHCHILSHEDLGMMAIIRVCPVGGPCPTN